MNAAAAHDVIIVGSGAGGAAAAYRLVKEGVSVLMLERGTALPRDGSTLDDFKVVTRGDFLSKQLWRDGAGNDIYPEEHFNLGGKTKWYGAAVLRYSPREFAAEAAYGARGWPIAYTDLEPYYEEAERLLGARSFECEPDLKKILDQLSSNDKGWTSIPMTLALSPAILDNPLEATHFDGFASVADLKGDAQSSFLTHIIGNPLFTLRTGADVVELLPADSGPTRIGGVKLESGEVLQARTVLLACGALHSPLLLERYLRDAGPASGLAPCGVGRNLKKNVLTALVAVSFGKKSDLLRKTMLTTHARFPHSSLQPLGFDAELIATLIPKFVPRFLAHIISRRAYGFFLQTEDGSHEDNLVTDCGTRVMDYDAARLPLAIQEHTQFTRAFERALLAAGMLSFTQRTGITGTAHVCGTLMTGTERECAVVDANGEVFGIEGLYVVDGSVLPRSSRVNPSLSIYAWALRVGHQLSQALKIRRGPDASGV